ncbi:hypothetical protein, partial [Salmonella enterica]|uniref:hypothetical protein n=1 Tax=Salmonella enterica TaxID=28901 RepID=UPI003CECBF6E
EIADLEKKIEQAQMAGDLAALNKLVAVDMIYNVGNPPSVLSREQIERRWAAKKEGRMGVVVESDVVFR